MPFRIDLDTSTHTVTATLTYTETQAELLGFDIAAILDRTDTAILALADFRSDNTETSADTYGQRLTDVEPLVTQLGALRDALIVGHTRAGGSVNELALALNCPRSTAQSRREAAWRKPLTALDRQITDGRPATGEGA
jgi:hypothetical protein